jgi:hypothetical protein
MLVSGFGFHVTVSVAATAGDAHASSRIANNAVVAARASDDRPDREQALCFDPDCTFAIT